MNKRLQAILDLIQQSESITAEEKKSLADAIKESDKEITITEFKLERTEKVKRTTGILLEETIAELEQKRKSVEVQNRELEIEAALERVRSRSIAMRQSSELGDLSFELVKQVQSLGIATWHCAFNIYDEDQESSTEWGSNAEGSYPIYKTPREGIFKRYYEIGQRGETLHVEVIGEDKCADHYAYLCTLPGVGETLVKVRDSGTPFPKSQIDHVAYFKYGYLLFITFEPAPEAHDVFKRFAKVFEQTYTRFLDLQQAEAQTREARIEAGLERVRSRAMAMQTSDELNALIGTVFTELTKLDLVLTRCVIMTYDQKTNDARWWMANSEAPEQPMNFNVKYHEHPPNLAYFSAWRERTVKWIYPLEGSVKKEWDDFLFSKTELRLLPDFVIAGMKAPNRVYLNASFYNSGNLTLATLEPLSDEHFDILIRFAKVFDLTYTRFNDLKQAEAQAKEAKIEAALERVRSRTMAMQRSEELLDVASILFQQVKALGVPQWNCGFNIWKIGDKEFIYYPGSPDGIILPTPCKIPLTEHPVFISFDESRKRGDELFVYEKEGEFQSDHYRYMLSLRPGVGDLLQSMLDAGFKLPTFQIDHVANFSYGNLIFITYQHFPEMHDVFKRFAKVFEQTYTRFLDLQKAESQTREAQIEASLERVRSKAMAMHKSEDLTAAVAVVFEELEKLNIGMSRCGIGIHNKEKRSSDVWTTSKPEGKNMVHVSGDESMDVHHLLQKAFDAWLTQEDFSYVLQGEDLAAYYRALQHTNFRLPESEAMVTNAETLQQHYYVTTFPAGALFAFRENPFTDEAKNVMKRFANVFNLTYKRFQDIQKAEAQAREAKIEAVLERVRSRTMAMHKSEELTDVAGLLFEQVRTLDIKTWTAGFNVWSEDNNSYVDYITSPQGGFIEPYTVYTDKAEALTDIGNARKSGVEFDVQYVEGEKIKELYLALTKLDKEAFEIMLQDGVQFPSHQYEHFVFGSKVSLMFITYEPVPEAHDIFKRLGKVFEQTYTRFLDLQKAEAQVREAQIEASLERVRSKSMAMHKSEEILEVIKTMCDQFTHLGFEFHVVNIGTDFRNREHDLHVWIYGKDAGNIYPHRVRIPYIDNALLFKIKESLEKGVDFFSITLSKDEKDEFYQHLFNNTIVGSLIPDERKQFLLNEAIYSSSIYILRHTLLILINYNGRPFSEEHNAILKRFGNVFEQSYTRFMDLEKAEAQARESQIEAALERVRSRTMAMHRSEEIADIVGKIFKELTLLDVALNRVLIWIFNPDEKYISWWSANPEAESNAESYRVDYNDNPVFLAYFNAWEKRQSLMLYTLGGNLKKLWEDHLFQNTGLSRLPSAVQDGMRSEKNIFTTSAIGDYGLLMAGCFEPFSDEINDIIQRFGRVFQQSYTRYVDVQKAEAQAREATIEASLEKVRGKAMAMHNSNDLVSTASLVFTELRKLGINSFRNGVGLLTKENRNVKLYSATSSEEGGSFSVVGWAVLDHHPVLTKTYDSWVNNEDYFPVLKGETLKSYYEKIVATFTVPVEQSDGYEQHGYFLPFSEGLFYGWSEKPFTEQEIKILNRFRGIVDLTFRRYIELQKSEENTKEAIRQASLDRVRAEIASMRTTTDLDRITPLIWKELNILNIPFVRCGVFIMDDFQQLIHTFLSTPEGKAIAAFHLPYETPGNIGDLLNHWRTKQMYISHWDATAFSELGELLVQQGAIPSKEVYMNTVPVDGIHLHCLPFMQGMLYVGNTTQLQESDIHLIQAVADAFSTAYARYEDFNKLESAKAQIERTLTDLKQTQNLLVQSEKMASLGELTAGIAHEIQNPLNFVNNFSEVSNELLEEMKEEIQKGNYDDVEAITNNIKLNLEKILHHGKRADGIVKGMLQHSRSSSGVKEPTDINSLADEYLRLAYHGFRAKDKSFNAYTNTDLDKSIGKINVVPQDIGRVVLNLITNAFYTVTEKQKQTNTEYRPTVFLSTKRHDNCVLISVKDNGNGIPKHIREKIFQPFFTTKPTGQGTGLGLSLSYDIVKAHGGELAVETKESEGSEFVIQLPVS